MRKIVNFISAILISICLCACNNNRIKENQNYLLESRSDFIKINNINNSKVWHRVEHFKNKNEAESYFRQRRLELQRLYELTSEPYFGTSLARDCSKNIDVSGEIKKNKSGEYYFLKMLGNENFALGDCLKKNNYYYVRYEFYLCGGDVFEVRSFFPYELLMPKEQILECPMFI